MKRVRTYAVISAAVAALAGTAAAQLPDLNVQNNFQYNYTNLGPGSTVEGDYLRGAGYAIGQAGLAAYYSAQAQSINVNSFIRLNEYIYLSIQHENREKARRIGQRRAWRLRCWNAIQDRIRDNPEERDVMTGDGLNSLRDRILSPQIPSSAYRFGEVKLDSAVVRKIPFEFAERGARVSMVRMTAGEWPVWLRGKDFEAERRRYDRALDTVLDQQYEKALSKEAVRELEAAVQGLFQRVDLVPVDDRERMLIEAKSFLRKLAKCAEQFKYPEVEKIVAEINKYSGVTVLQLAEFMRDYKLRFGPSEIGEERKLYAELYAAMSEQLASVEEGRKEAEDKPRPREDKGLPP